MTKVEKIQVTGNRLPGRPKGTLEQLVQRDMKKKGLKEEQALDRKSWKNLIKGLPIAGKERTAGEKDDNEVDVYEYMGLYASVCGNTHEERDHRESNLCKRENMDFK